MHGDDHRAHMQYEIERQDREWKALNRRERRQGERIKTFVIGILLIIAVLAILKLNHQTKEIRAYAESSRIH